MRRRKLLALAAGSAVSPVGARAQRRLPTIGMLGIGHPDDPAIALNLAMFKRGLKSEGFVDGQNVRIEYRWANNQSDRLPRLAAELVGLPVDVIVNEGGTVSAIVAKRATSTIPIVFHSSNAIADGLVDNLAQPRGNLTGVSQFATETLIKGYQFLVEMAPKVRAVVIVSVAQAASVAQRVVQEIKAGSGPNKATIDLRAIENDADLEPAYAALAKDGAAALVFANATYVETLVRLAGKYRVPAVYNQRAYVAAGGLLSYGASIPAAYVIKGLYTGRILKGAKPGELPVQQASKFELVLNLKTAAALGLAVPQSILIGADEVIE